MNYQDAIKFIVPLIGIYLLFKDKIDKFIKQTLNKAPKIGMPVEGDLSQPAAHFQRCCNLDNEPMNAAMAVAKALGEGEEQDNFIKNTVPILIKQSLKKGKDE